MRRLKLGILANEFFDQDLGRMGGFGWAARQIARIMRDPRRGVDVVYFTGELRATPGRAETVVHGTRLLLREGAVWRDVRRVRAEHVDLLLLMDYRPNYRLVCWALGRTPMIVWVRDPRPPSDVAKVDTLRLPDANGVRPQGIVQPNCRSLGTLLRITGSLGRPVLFASPAPHLRPKLEAMLGMQVGEFAFLPNPVDLATGTARKSERPQVVFLARLDPYKRPWLFAELARGFPDVEFLFAGRAHYHGEGAWQPRNLPPNVRMLGHIDGPEKARVLSSAWALVNTSIHEGLAVSFLEALAWETPLLACVNPGDVVSRFGVYVGRFDGTGLEALPRLTAGLGRLLAAPAWRREVGRAGRAWVESTHTPERFLQALSALAERAGVRRTDSDGRRGMGEGSSR